MASAVCRTAVTKQEANNAAKRRVARLCRHVGGVGASVAQPGAKPTATTTTGFTAQPTACCSGEDFLSTPDGHLQEDYDYIVVGSGSSGAVVAARLSQDPHVSVLLLEAGEAADEQLRVRCPSAFIKLQASEYDWQLKTPPEPGLGGRIVKLPRGRILGGCSCLNCCVYVRGHKENYNGYARMGCHGWSYDEMLPYFKKSEDCRLEGVDADYHSTGGRWPITDARQLNACNPLTTAFVEGCDAAGIPRNPDYNGKRQEGAFYTQFSIRDGNRASTAESFLRLAHNDDDASGAGGGAGAQQPLLPQAPMARTNLTILCGAHVTRVVVSGGKTIGVTAKLGSTDFAKMRTLPDTFLKCKREVVLCAGAYHTPAILMRSGIGPADHLRDLGIPVVADLPVGNNLSDHLMTWLTHVGRDSTAEPAALFHPRRLLGIAKYIVANNGALSTSPLQGTAFLHSGLPKHALDGAPDATDTQIHFIPSGPIELALELGTMNKTGTHTDPSNLPMYGALLIPILLRPLSRGTVRLVSTDPLLDPEIKHNFLQEQRDMDVLVAGLRKCREIAKTPAMAKVLSHEIIDESIPHDPESTEYLEEFVRRTTNTVYHPCGTCRMGDPNVASTVVDPHGRVVGIAGLRVADASILPAVPSGNTNAPCVAVGEKVAADMLKDMHG